MQNFEEYIQNKNLIVRKLFNKLLIELDTITKKDYVIERKKDSLHIVKNTAFLGVHFLKGALRLNIVLKHPLKISLKIKTDRPSANIYHNKVDLEKLEDINEDLLGYIKEAYELKR